MGIKNYGEWLNESDYSINEDKRGMIKAAVQQALGQAGFKLKQKDFKVGIKKDGAIGYQVYLNDQFLGYDDNWDEMIDKFHMSIKDEPESFGLKESVNEGAKFKGADIFPNWLTAEDFGDKVKSEKDLNLKANYIIKDPGDNSWHGDYEFRGIEGDDYVFVDAAQFSQGGEYLIGKKELKDFEIYAQN